VHAAVLHYRHGRGFEYPAPLQDAQQSMRVLRERWQGSVSKVAAIGFSAGGHLVSMLSNLPELPVPDVKHVPQQSIRPDAAALIYAVIALTGVANEPGSRRNLLGETHSEELAMSVSTQLHVTAQTPPTFLFHAQNDETVSPAHPIAYVQSLLKHQVPVELHLYPDAGGHGVGLAANHPRASLWPSLCVSWLRSMGF
jgi:acetyl esterase/lipase